MKLLEQDYFVIKFSDGMYRSSEYAHSSINRAIKYRYLEDAKDAADDFNKHGDKCEIIPVRVTIKEIKKREILCYFMNPIQGNGWGFRPDEHMKFYWSILMPYGYGALTD